MHVVPHISLIRRASLLRGVAIYPLRCSRLQCQVDLRDLTRPSGYFVLIASWSAQWGKPPGLECFHLPLEVETHAETLQKMLYAYGFIHTYPLSSIDSYVIWRALTSLG